MAEEHDHGLPNRASGKFLGSLREALSAAARDDTDRQLAPEPAPIRQGAPDPEPPTERPPQAATAIPPTEAVRPAGSTRPLPSAAEAARTARGGAPNVPPIDRHVEFEAPPTTRVVRPEPMASHQEPPARTQLVRGRQPVKRGKFHQDPVVGWLVVVGGPGLGAYRPIFEGNNTVGRSPTQRIAIDFGDEAISSEEQAYVRYDSADRCFLFVPNLAKTNVVSVNEKRPTAAVPLTAMDVITMGRTQLVFVPFCGPEFDWSELPDIKD